MNTNSSGKNVVFILADDMGAWSMGCAGNAEIQTPHLDRIATLGRRFTEFYCASPICSPARASILTGQMPSWHGVQDWLHSGNIDREDLERFGLTDKNPMYAKEAQAIPYLENQVCFTDVLRQHGYRIALSGKWHLGDSLRPQHGFSHWYTMIRGACDYMHPDIVENGQAGIVDAYSTDLFTEHALGFMDTMKEQPNPFFLAVHYNAPHSPWRPDCHKAEDLALYHDCPFNSVPNLPDHPNATGPQVGNTPKRRENLEGYFAAMTAMDRSIGNILDYLESNDLLKNTLVFFMGDNGMNMGHHGLWGKGNATFPVNMYEESIKVPFIAMLPVMNNPGRPSPLMLSQVDFFPTLLELLDIPVAENYRGPGRSFASAIEGLPISAVPLHPYLYICEEYGPTRMIKSERYKYIHRYYGGSHEFYDLLEDPQEENNAVALEKYQAIITTMRKELEDWFLPCTDPDKDGRNIGPNNDYAKGSGQLDRVGCDRTQGRSFS